MKADLSKTVDIDGMQRLGEAADDGIAEGLGDDSVETVEIEVAGALEGTARKIRVQVSKPESFTGRDGYNPDFLDGWSIPLPKPGKKLAKDIRKLRRGGEGHELKYEHFSTVQSASRRMPMFVGVNIDGTKERRIVRTSTPWRFDGRLDVADQIGDEVYSEEANLLDRGHMVRREDPIWGTMKVAARANVDTFHFTNAAPQMGVVNQRTWLGLEQYVLRNTRDDDMAVSVFTGPVFTDDDFPYRGALIPKSFWKVVAVITDEGRPSATAYEISQENELSTLEFVFGAYKTFQISIEELQEKTSLSFGDLAKYDGFSKTERKSGRRTRTELESLEMVRI